MHDPRVHLSNVQTNSLHLSRCHYNTTVYSIIIIIAIVIAILSVSKVKRPPRRPVHTVDEANFKHELPSRLGHRPTTRGFWELACRARHHDVLRGHALHWCLPRNPCRRHLVHHRHIPSTATCKPWVAPPVKKTQNFGARRSPLCLPGPVSRCAATKLATPTPHRT